MASWDLQKYAIAKYSGLSVHIDQEKRLVCEHPSNKHIDKSLSYQNYFVGVSSFNEMVERVKHRTEEVDAILPPKRVAPDRVTAIAVCLPCPLEIEKMGRSDEFFQKGYEWLQNKIGAENCHGMAVHKDEKHIYYDTDKGQYTESLYHAHGVISPYTKEHGINAKHFMTREMLWDLQKEFNLYVYQEFGVEMLKYTTPRHESVEHLKQESEIAELTLKRDKLRQEWNEWGVKYQEILQEYAETYESIKELEEKRLLLEAQIQNFKNEAAALVSRANNLEKQLLDEKGFIERFVAKNNTDEAFRQSRYVAFQNGRELFENDLRAQGKKFFREITIPELAQERQKLVQQVHHMHM